MAVRNVKVFEVNVGPEMLSIFGALGRAKGASLRNQALIAAQVRVELKKALLAVVAKVVIDGDVGYRSGRARRTLLGGTRVFGTRFLDIRGHIIGPGYVKLREEGGTIFPVAAEALAIPLPAALRPDGSPKLPGPRSWQGILKTFIYKSKRTGKFYIAYKGATGRLTLLYVLVDSADFPAEGFLRDAWNSRRDNFMVAVGRIMLSTFNQIDFASLTGIKRNRR
jgi:hypothetical protein